MRAATLLASSSIKGSFGPGCLALDQREMATDHEEPHVWRLYFNPSAKSVPVIDLNLTSRYRPP